MFKSSWSCELHTTETENGDLIHTSTMLKRKWWISFRLEQCSVRTATRTLLPDRGHYPTSLHIIFLFQIFIILKIFTLSVYFPVFSFSFNFFKISFIYFSLLAYHMWVALEYIGGIVEIYKHYWKKNLELSWLLLNLMNIMQHVVGSTLYLDITHHSLSKKISKKFPKKMTLKKKEQETWNKILSLFCFQIFEHLVECFAHVAITTKM